MRNRQPLVFLIGLILFGLVTGPALGANGEECVTAAGWASGASRDFIGIDFMDSQTGSGKTAQDYIETGNYYRCRCEKATDAYYLRVQTGSGEILQTQFGIPSTSQNMPPPAEKKQLMRKTAGDIGLYNKDPLLAQYEKDMLDMCNEANIHYAAALDKTPDDDYREQAEIYDSIAGVYETAGELEMSDEARQEALDARVRAEAKDAGFKSDCLIVTATFGSPMANEVQLVRDFRDNTIKQDYLGSRYVTALNAIYYSLSPFVARTIDQNPSVKPAMRVILAPLIGIVLLSQGLYSLLAFSPEVATVAFIVFGGTLVGLVYIMPFMLSAIWIAAGRQWRVPSTGSLKPLVILWACLLGALVAGAVMRIDFITILSSGLLFVCTVIMAAVATALCLSARLGIAPAARRDE